VPQPACRGDHGAEKFRRGSPGPEAARWQERRQDLVNALPIRGALSVADMHNENITKRSRLSPHDQIERLRREDGAETDADSAKQMRQAANTLYSLTAGGIESAEATAGRLETAAISRSSISTPNRIGSAGTR
jgi:hypothetical protein